MFRVTAVVEGQSIANLSAGLAEVQWKLEEGFLSDHNEAQDGNYSFTLDFVDLLEAVHRGKDGRPSVLKPLLRIENVLAGPDPQMGWTPAAVLHCKAISARWVLENMGYDEDGEPPSDVIQIEEFIERMRKVAQALCADFEIDDDVDEFLEELRSPGDDDND